MSLQVFGRSGFAAAVDRGFKLAEAAEAAVRSLPDWEVVTPAQMAVLTFRYAPPGLAEPQLEGLNRALIEELIADGFAMLSTTVLKGRTVLRMCTINPRTTQADVVETVERLNVFARRRYVALAGS
jgi:glutamate/tyrosine decarboxylase-like PLP-dependent enzyme